MPELPETTQRLNAELIAQRARQENRRDNLPRFAEGMTPRAASVETERARRRAAVQKSIEQDEKNQQQEMRAAARLPRDPTDEAASAIFYALRDGSESARHYAAQLLKHAPDELRAAVMQLAGADSEFKRRRSRRPNGF